MANKETESTTARGKGQSGLVAATTTTLVKATATVPTSVIQAVRTAAITPPATSCNFDRTVATSLGK